MKTPRSLSSHVTIWLAVAVGLGMAAYAIYQYATMPGQTARDLLLHHSWHVLVLGAVIYIISWVMIEWVLVRPLEAIYVHLYAIGAGRRSRLEIQSNVREIVTIVEGINLMLQRLEQSPEDGAIQRAQFGLAQLRKSIEELEVASPEAKVTTLDKLAGFEKSLSAVLQNIKAASAPREENSHATEKNEGKHKASA